MFHFVFQNNPLDYSANLFKGMGMEKMFGRKIEMPLVTHLGTLNSNRTHTTQTWHSHRGFELLFVQGGATAWEFQGRDPIEITGGHFLIVPSGIEHRGMHAMRQPSQICGLLVDCDSPKGTENTSFTKKDLKLIGDSLAASALTVLSSSSELISRVNRLISLKRAHETYPENPMLGFSLRTQICSVLVETVLGVQARPERRPAIAVTAAEEYLQKHLNEPIRMDDLIKYLGFSRSYVFSTFKTVTGMTPNDYFIRSRIKHAQKMLSESEKSVTTVALDCGFASSQYFSSVFRKHTGQTPSEYRQELRADR